MILRRRGGDERKKEKRGEKNSGGKGEERKRKQEKWKGRESIIYKGNEYIYNTYMYTSFCFSLVEFLKQMGFSFYTVWLLKSLILIHMYVHVLEHVLVGELVCAASCSKIWDRLDFFNQLFPTNSFVYICTCVY